MSEISPLSAATNPLIRTAQRTWSSRLAPLALVLMVFTLTGCVELEELRRRTSKQEAEITRLREENDRLEQAYYEINEGRNSETGGLKQQVELLQAEVERARNLRSGRERELEEQLRELSLKLDVERTEAEARTQKHLAETAALSQALADAQSNLEALEKKGGNEAAQARISILTEDVESLRDRLEEERARNVSSTQAIEELRTQAAAGTEQQVALKAQVDALTSEKQALTSEKSALQSQLDEALKGIAATTVNLEELKTQATTLQGENAAAQQRTETLRAEVEGLRAELEQVQQKHDTATRTIDELKARATTAEAASTTSQERLQSLKTENETLRASLDSERKTASEVGDALTASREKQELLAKEIETLRSQFDEKRQQYDAATIQIDELKAKVTASEGVSSAAQERVEALRAEIEGMRAQLDQERQKYDSATRTVDELRAQAAQNAEATTAAQERAKTLAAEVEQLQLQAAAIEPLKAQAAEADALRARVAELEPLQEKAAEADTLRARVAELEPLAAQASGIDALRLEMANLQAKNADLMGTGTLVVPATELDALKTQAGEAQTLRARIAELEPLQARIAELEPLQEKAAEAEALRARVAELEAAPKPEAKPELDPLLESAGEEINAKLAEVANGNKVLTIVDTTGLRVIIPNDLAYQPASVLLADAGKPILMAIAEVVSQKLPDHEMRIEGHTDNQPLFDLPFADNWGLSNARADSVRKFFETQGGLSPSNIQVVARSMYDPMSDNSTPEGRANNRRVEIVFPPFSD